MAVFTYQRQKEDKDKIYKELLTVMLKGIKNTAQAV